MLAAFVLSIVKMLLGLFIGYKPPAPVEAAEDPRAAEFHRRKRG
jgi:hypothetical protein